MRPFPTCSQSMVYRIARTLSTRIDRAARMAVAALRCRAPGGELQLEGVLRGESNVGPLPRSTNPLTYYHPPRPGSPTLGRFVSRINSSAAVALLTASPGEQPPALMARTGIALLRQPQALLALEVTAAGEILTQRPEPTHVPDCHSGSSSHSSARACHHE
jgi:hypothetical protein